MLPEDERHGTNAGYINGCRERCCKTAHADYKRDRRTRIYLAKGPLTIDATGTRRRIQALVALGHSMEAMDVAMGKSRGYTFNAAKHDWVHRTTAELVAKLYGKWSMTIPTAKLAQRNRNLARRHGWPVPLAWDEGAIDDPMARPRTGTNHRRRDDIDHAVIERFLCGEHGLKTTPAERRVIVARWPGSLADLERQTGWATWRYVEKGDVA